MAEKDITEKTLEAYNDVFADIVNVLLFNGEQIVKEDELMPETPRSIYKADEKLHEQERDVAKFWNRTNVRIALYGLENQTAVDADIPLRVISYDGAAYRNQLNVKKDADPRNQPDAEKAVRYPVVTLVLYFGYDHWNKAHSLYECLQIPEEVKPYVSDYKVNIFEIAWLTPEQVKLFKSDFKYVADYFVQMRQNKNYVPSPEVITHVREVLLLLKTLTKDNRFETFANEVKEGEKITMCEMLDKVEARGEARGYARGEACGYARGEAEAAKKYEAKLAEMKAELEKYKALAAKA